MRKVSEDWPLTPEETKILVRLIDDIMIYRVYGPMNFGAAKGLARRTSGSGQFKCWCSFSRVWRSPTPSRRLPLKMPWLMPELIPGALLARLRPRVRSTLERLGVTDRIAAHHYLEILADTFTYASELIAQRG